MDDIKFRIRTSSIEDYQVVDIYLNGWNLIDLLYPVELPLAHDEGLSAMAGCYEGLPPLLSLPPHQHFWGKPSHADYQLGEQRIVLLENGQSGVPGEWSIACDVEVTGEHITWKNLHKPQRPSWDYSSLGNFQFDLVTFRDALRAALQAD